MHTFNRLYRNIREILFFIDVEKIFDNCGEPQFSNFLAHHICVTRYHVSNLEVNDPNGTIDGHVYAYSVV